MNGFVKSRRAEVNGFAGIYWMGRPLYEKFGFVNINNEMELLEQGSV